jgi:hypothetical protein
MIVGCVVAIVVLPDEPSTTKWLTPAQRQIAHDRVANDTVQKK